MLKYSLPTSLSLNSNVYFKIETLQPSRSFKYRGISQFAKQALEKYGSSVHLTVASDGDDALAAACAAKALNVRCTAFLSERADSKLANDLDFWDAEVIISGNDQAEAITKAEEIARLDSNAIMIPRDDDLVLWPGHSSLVHELHSELLGIKPNAIFCSAYSVGLLGGLIHGCRVVGWDDVPIVALENRENDRLSRSIFVNKISGRESSEQKFRVGVTMPDDSRNGAAMPSISGTLSVPMDSSYATVSPHLVELAREPKGQVKCVAVPEEMSLSASVRFACEESLICPLPYSTALVPAYNGSLFKHVCTVPSTTSSSHGDDKKPTVVFIVCGSGACSFKEFLDYAEREKQRTLQTQYGEWIVMYNGEELHVPTEDQWWGLLD